MSENKKVIVTDGQDLAEKAEELKKSGVTDVTVVVLSLIHILRRLKKWKD